MLTREYVELIIASNPAKRCNSSSIWDSCLGYFSDNRPSTLRFLFVGLAESGKSSFINTLLSVSTHDGLSVQSSPTGGIYSADTCSFPLASSPPCLWSTIEEVDCLGLVIDVPRVPTLECVTWFKFSLMVDAARMKGIPVVVIVTKIDQLCPEISENPLHALHDEDFQRITRVISAKIPGIPGSRIIPIRNASNDAHISRGTIILAHMALEKIQQLYHRCVMNAENSKHGTCGMRPHSGPIAGLKQLIWNFRNVILLVIIILGLGTLFGWICCSVGHNQKAAIVYVTFFRRLSFNFGFMSEEFRKELQEKYFTLENSNDGYYD